MELSRVKEGVSYFDLNGQGPALLCLHGIQGCKESFEKLRNSSVGKEYRLIIPDLPGFGESSTRPDGGVRLPQQAESIKNFIESLKLDRLAIYGHSLGGMLGILLLDMIPERITALICSEGNLRLEDCGESRKVAALSFNEFQMTRLPELRRKGVAVDPLTFYETSKSVVEVSSSEKLYHILLESPRPVLFIRGGESHFETVPSGNNVRTVEIPGESHFSLLKSDAVIRAIENFLLELTV